MKSLKQLIKHPQIRFKTIGEMFTEFGSSWMSCVPCLKTNDVATVMSYYSGKVLYPSSVIHHPSIKTCFLYTPMNLLVHQCMLTTHALSKYDYHGNVLKVGHIVRVEYLPIDFDKRSLIPSCLRNEPGTLTKILKVINPSDYLIDDTMFDKNRKDKMNISYVAVELKNQPKEYFLSMFNEVPSTFFKDGIVRAFELTHKLVKATESERKYYYKTIQFC